MELVLIMWMLFGIVCAIIASSKNRSAFGWFVLGVLFGPLSILFIAIARKEDTVI